MATKTVMSRRDRLRRVAILCRNFVVNLAYYRVGRQSEYVHLFDYPTNLRANFWRATNSNFIDICVLEWCKLLGDANGKHHWGKIVSDPARFMAELLRHLGVDEAGFRREIEIMRHYRDKFLAHLDSDPVMNIPSLEIAKKSVWFYYGYLIQHEAQLDDLADLYFDLDSAYAKCEEQARAVYEQNA